jgi:hypothetical protein
MPRFQPAQIAWQKPGKVAVIIRVMAAKNWILCARPFSSAISIKPLMSMLGLYTACINADMSFTKNTMRR